MTYHSDREDSECDVLILGSGIAGALLAYELAQKQLKVVIASKGSLMQSNTAWAQGGLAAVTQANPLDHNELHLQDTLSSGAGLTDERVAKSIVENGQALATRLTQLGVEFDKTNGVWDAALEGGHSKARVLHSTDASGHEIALALVAAVRNHADIQIMEDAFALDVSVRSGKCIGAHILYKDQLMHIRARHTVLATGGLGQVFSRTTNPAVATGDGIAMAYRAGARLVDMEFIQFHPTALVKEGAPAALISEAIRGAGAHLLDASGNRFAFRFHKDGELATRDIVARGIYTTMLEQQSSSVFLDLRPIGTEVIERKFPNILKACRSHGVDPVFQPIPVAPAAHYFMGGVWVDEYARTTIPNLFAIGECSSTGLHGANRLASNSLLEGGVMAMQLAKYITESQMPAQNNEPEPLLWLQAPYAVMKQIGKFKHAMFENVGLERSENRLQDLINSLPESVEYRVPADRTTAESANIALLGWLIARSALERKESRGAHWRTDFPTTDDVRYRKRLCLTKDDGMSWLEVSRGVGRVGVGALYGASTDVPVAGAL